MEFIDPQLDQYCQNHSSEESDLLKKLNRETHANILKPRMLSGHIQGRLLAMWSKMMQPKKILEIGTYTGYSALCLAEGLQKEGVLTTIEVNEELETFTKSFFDASKYASQIDFRIGQAAPIIETLQGPFDIVFIDADKKSYSLYFDQVIEKMATNGIIIADNVLWSGKVIGSKIDKDTQALLDFNLKVQNDPRVNNILLPVRDGLMVAQKI